MHINEEPCTEANHEQMDLKEIVFIWHSVLCYWVITDKCAVTDMWNVYVNV